MNLILKAALTIHENCIEIEVNKVINKTSFSFKQSSFNLGL
jgi:predicted nucleic acid-binding Zn ribbon protein